MPLRKKVIDAPISCATRRKRGNRPVDRLAAPSQEKTTNCGGRSPGASLRGTGWGGCGPVSALGPSPIGRPSGVGAGSGGGAAEDVAGADVLGTSAGTDAVKER